MEQGPFDGLLFHVVSDRGDSLTWHIWSPRRFERSDFDGAVADLDSTPFRRFTELFLGSARTGRRQLVRRRACAWATIAQTSRSPLAIAATDTSAGCSSMPEEQYSTPLFDHQKIQALWPGSFEKYRAIVRQRGREWIRAINGEYSDLTIVMPVGYAAAQPPRWPLDRSHAHYGLLADFLDGVLEAASPRTTLVDGCRSRPIPTRRRISTAPPTTRSGRRG